jgi:hypothetical protein
LPGQPGKVTLRLKRGNGPEARETPMRQHASWILLLALTAAAQPQAGDPADLAALQQSLKEPQAHVRAALQLGYGAAQAAEALPNRPPGAGHARQVTRRVQAPRAFPPGERGTPRRLLVRWPRPCRTGLDRVPVEEQGNAWRAGNSCK